MRGIHRGPVNSPHKWPATRKMFPFDDVIMVTVSDLLYPHPVSEVGLLLTTNKRVDTLRPRQNGGHFLNDVSNAFSWMKMFEVLLDFHRSLFLGSDWQYTSIGSDNGSAPNSRQAIIWTNNDLFHGRIYASLGLNELREIRKCTYILQYSICK